MLGGLKEFYRIINLEEYLQYCLLCERTPLKRPEKKQLLELIYGRHICTVQMDRIRKELNVSR